MACFLKQSTAVEIKLGPFVDSVDGNTAETGLTIEDEHVDLAKNGGDWGDKAETTTCVHESQGWYRCLLDTTDTNTLGILIVKSHVTGALPVWREFMVVAANIYDSLIGGGDVLDVSLIQVNGAAQTATLDTLKTDTAAILVDTAEIGSTGAGLTSLASAANLATVAGYLDTEIAAIKAKTDSLTFTVAGDVDVNVQTWSGTAVAAPDTAGYPVVTIKDGTGQGEINTSSGRVSADVARWLGDAVPATSVAGVPKIDITHVNGAAQTATLDTIKADTADIPTNAELATALGTADDAVLAQVALVKAKTDSLTFTVANQIDANIQYINDTEIVGDGTSPKFGV